MGKFLVQMVKPLIGQILITLGLSAVTYTGADLLLTQLTNYLQANLYNMPLALIQLLGLCGFDKALSIVFSAFMVNFTMRSTFNLKGKK